MFNWEEIVRNSDAGKFAPAAADSLIKAAKEGKRIEGELESSPELGSSSED